MKVIAFFFFFFFFFNDIYKYPLIKQSFSMAVGQHLNDYGYIDMSSFISGPNKNEVIRTLGTNDSSAKKLYAEPFPTNEINPSDILECFLILSIKKNERIIRQHGAFMVFGLVDSSLSAEKLRYQIDGKRQIFIVPRHAKKNLLKELEYYKINEAILFPEINSVAKHTREKFFEE